MTMKQKIVKGVVVTFIMIIPLLILGAIETQEIAAFDPVKHYDSIEKSAKGISEYKQSNDVLIESFIEKDLADIRCTVTFEKAITLNELKTICTSNKIDLKVVETRHIINGKKYTSATIFNGNFEDLQNEINEITDDLGGGFVGVIDVYACIDSEYVDDVKKDQKVFLVDVSGDAASIGYYIKNGDTRNKERFDDGLNDFPHAMSWDLEELR